LSPPESHRVRRLRRRSANLSEARAEVASLAIGYVRVSTDEQAGKHGPEVQEQAIRAFATSQGYELLDVVTDLGVSGATRPSDRRGFSTLVNRGAAILLVWKFDRLARHIAYAVTTVHELAERGTAIRSVTEPIDTSGALGRTIFAVLAGMAEQERHGITERTWSGRRAKASQGGFAGGPPPYGYRNESGVLIIDETEASVVRRIFALRAAGMDFVSIARNLNSEGICTRRGKPWRHGNVSYILDNPKYQGDVEYLFRWAGGEKHVRRAGDHQAIVGRPNGRTDERPPLPARDDRA